MTLRHHLSSSSCSSFLRSSFSSPTSFRRSIITIQSKAKKLWWCIDIHKSFHHSSSSPVVALNTFACAFSTNNSNRKRIIHRTTTTAAAAAFQKHRPFNQQYRQQRTIMSATAKSTKKATTTKGKVPKAKAKNTPAKKKANPTPTLTITHVSDEYIPEWMNKERTKILYQPEDITKTATNSNSNENKNKCVYYWMQRDVRTDDNWALLFAQHLAQMQDVPLRVFYVLPCPYIDSSSTTKQGSNSNEDDLPPKVCEMQMTQRHGSFLLGGLQIVEKELRDKNVPFDVLMSSSHDNVGQTVHDFVMAKCKSSGDIVHEASVLVCDMNPLRQFRNWVEDQTRPLMKESDVPFYQVDAHNVVPVWLASPKREVGARTLRPKINKLLPDFLTHFPEFEGNNYVKESICSKKSIKWVECETYLQMDDSVKTVSWAKPGKKAAMARFDEFCNSKTEGLKNFDSLRNDPNYSNVCSNLSPWVNYGMVSFQRLALDIRALKKHPNGTASYIEEGIVRRELSDNFVYYSKENYDDLSTAAEWAQETLRNHTADEREYLYSTSELEYSRTHDDLWNAAQIQLVSEGHMHGFLRMYWAKKILEWTKSPALALRTGLYFNDRYALDGNDPNGFTGVGWSIMGIHDMGWKERPIFGKIRFMNYAGCKRKFKVDQFVSRYRNAVVNAIKDEAKQEGRTAAVARKTIGKKRKASAR